MKIFICMSHELSPSQKASLLDELGVNEVVLVSKEIKAITSKMSAKMALEEVKSLAQSVVAEAIESGSKVALLTGEPTLTIHMNILAMQAGIRCVMSTTERGLDSEVVQPDGTVRKVQNFNHVCWRDVF